MFECLPLIENDFAFGHLHNTVMDKPVPVASSSTALYLSLSPSSTTIRSFAILCLLHSHKRTPRNDPH